MGHPDARPCVLCALTLSALSQLSLAAQTFALSQIAMLAWWRRACSLSLPFSLSFVLVALLYANSPSVSAASHAAPWLEATAPRLVAPLFLLCAYSQSDSAAAFELLELPVPPCFDGHFPRVCPLSPQRPHEYARLYLLTGPFSSQSAWRIPALAVGRPRGGGSAMGIFNAVPLRTFSLAS